jgi:hypothetical protein
MLRRHRFMTLAVAPAALAALLGLAACGSTREVSSSSASAPAAEGAAGGASDAQRAMAEPAAPVPGASSAAVAVERSGTTAVSPALAPTVQLIRTADVVIEVKALDTSAARVRTVAQSLGGSVSSEVTSYPDAPVSAVSTPLEGSSSEQQKARPGESVIVLRVPVAALDQAIDRVTAVGTVLSRTSSALDVTADLADVGSRVKTQRASVDRVRQLLAKASSLQDVVLLESELTRREADLEALQARQSSLADRAALSTLTVTLRTPQVADDTTEDSPGFLSGLHRGWAAVIASTAVVLTILGALLPLLVVIALIGVPAWWFLRRRTARRRATSAAPAAPPSSSSPTPPVP